MDDQKFMKYALGLAIRGRGRVGTNPLVGAIIVRDGKILGRGWYRYYGAEHAEIMAIEHVLKIQPEALRGAELYCTLEPCSGNWEGKKQPPCSDRIIAEGISRVVIGQQDPNPEINGRGIEQLRNAGINLTVGLMEEQCNKLNEVYICNCTTKSCFVHLKTAQTLDGRIAAANGNSQWISSVASRREVHRFRAQYDAVVVGIGTVLADDPSLTVRHVRGRNPRRIILDSKLRLPLDSKIVQKAADGLSYVFHSHGDDARVEELRQHSVHVVELPADSKGGVDLQALLAHLHAENISSVYVEGGRDVFTSFIRAELFDKLSLYLAPCLMGNGLSSFADIGIEEIRNAISIHNIRTRIVPGSEDVCIEGYRK